MMSFDGMNLLQLFGSLLVLLTTRSEEKSTNIRFLVKPLASLVFIVTAFFAGAQETEYGIWIIVALNFSALGDVALLGKSSQLFLVGLVLFLIAHIAYIIAFLQRGIDIITMTYGVIAVLPIAAAVLLWLWPSLPQDMRIPVIAYTLVISAMVASAVGTFQKNDSADPNILLASIYFFISDIFIARDRFVRRQAINKMINLPLYYAAQFLFAYTTAPTPLDASSPIVFPLSYLVLRVITTTII